MNLKEKLTSRKFWAAIGGVIVGLIVAFGGEPATIDRVSGAVLSVISMISYIWAEAKIDIASINTDAPVVIEEVSRADEDDVE